MNRTNIFFGESHSDWLPVRGGESGDFVFRRGDGHAFAKIAPASRRGELAGERDRLIWLKGRGVACPEVINWQEEQEGACLVITAIPGVPAADLSGADLLKAWPSMGQQLGAVHSLSVDQCPFERRLSRMFGRAVDVVSRNAVNPDFLPDEDKSTPQLDLLARVERELPVRLDQERTDMVVCHGDPCMPNFMVDPKTLQLKPGQIRAQHLAVEEQQGRQCLTMRGDRNLALVRQPGQKCLDFAAAQGCRVTHTVETDEGTNPVDISLFGS
ncbi:APH(3'') family aminoglycoside O-phosphotransferase [Salmonella enterica]|nr:APH(3'') family aminoglycoside O-phosphotransferase [Salmonella enterica]EBS6273253.1 APH(3'') family aminoglycoside O-phosphotransferase [Salmonella enterica subsp. enterica serovar Enteritidis]EBI8487044.1 APH(3'') family aminoglycoside O-phosphotransferase [Salmonella enterica]EBS6273294.1 APH(3'') family aminoglycoside O-phosphotransferase [Salmonella enterica subsp. enterica serovar Enteritidis]EBX7045605.1 APH(3'') family aminoglycoside O-phosphotransferase [Salmonella enterica subsp. 